MQDFLTVKIDSLRTVSIWGERLNLANCVKHLPIRYNNGVGHHARQAKN
jgi:hypothetical protein